MEKRFRLFFFFFNDTAPTEIYPLSLHDALPISAAAQALGHGHGEQHRRHRRDGRTEPAGPHHGQQRSEEHTSELQSQSNLVCRLLLEKKKNYRQRCSRDYSLLVRKDTACTPHLG